MTVLLPILSVMSEHETWHPSKDEVAHILDELRPIISAFSRREESVLKAEEWRRSYSLV